MNSLMNGFTLQQATVKAASVGKLEVSVVCSGQEQVYFC